jgi:hypothetical protein
MTRTIRTLSLVAAAGGTAWLVKFLVIAATDGAQNGAADTATSVLYLLGVALMCVGAASLTLRAAAGRGRAATAVAILAAPLVAILAYIVVDTIVKPAVGDAGPSWLDDELPIAVTGACWLGVGLLARRGDPLRAGTPALGAQPHGQQV